LPHFARRSRFRLRDDRPERAVGNPDVQRATGTCLRYGTDRLPGGAVERDRVASREHGRRIEGRQLAAEKVEIGSPAAGLRVGGGAGAAQQDRELPPLPGNPRRGGVDPHRGGEALDDFPAVPDLGAHEFRERGRQGVDGVPLPLKEGARIRQFPRGDPPLLAGRFARTGIGPARPQ